MKTSYTSGFDRGWRILFVLPQMMLLVLGSIQSVEARQEGASEREDMVMQLETLFGTMERKTGRTSDSHALGLDEDRKPVRCLLPYHMMYEEVGEEVSPGTKKNMDDMLQMADGAALQSYTSDSGKFRILFTTLGSDAISEVDDRGTGIPDYVEWTAEYADSSYRHQVGRLGFIDPTVHQGTECGNRIGEWQDTVITIRYRSFNSYGRFYTNDPFGFEVHHTFNGFPPNDSDNQQRGALKATIAHEFKHVIQYATNCMQGDAGRGSWLEMDATMMENIVHPDVNDYYNYITDPSSVFHSPEYSIPASLSRVVDSYSHVTWFLFFAEKYGMDYWVDVWDRINQNHSRPLLGAMSDELHAREEDFEAALIRNHLWHLVSGRRSWNPPSGDGQSGYGFSEQATYPDASVIPAYSGLPGSLGKEVDVPLRGARYFEFSPNTEEVSGPVGLIQLFDTPGTGLGFLARMKNGDAKEWVIPSTDSQPLAMVLPLDWEDIIWLGVVGVNSDNATPSISQRYFGVGIEEKMQRLYGDVTFTGLLEMEDASRLLQYKLHPSSATIFHRYIGDVSGSGKLTHYDASLVYRYLDGNDAPFPADDDGSGLALKWDSGVHTVESNQGTVYPTAKAVLYDEVPDTVSAWLRLDTETITVHEEMDLVLSVPGATDSTWYSLYVEIAFTYFGNSGSDGGADLELNDLIAHHQSGNLSGWMYEIEDQILRLAYASSAPFSSADGPIAKTLKTDKGVTEAALKSDREKNADRISNTGHDTGLSTGPLIVAGESGGDNSPEDLIMLRLLPKKPGDIHFELITLELDERNYAFTHMLMDTAQVMSNVFAGGLGEKPLAFELGQNYPNPFNPETTISFVLTEGGVVTLELFDITGRRVALLLDGFLEPGKHTVRFDSRNHSGLASGVYIYRLQTSTHQAVRKMTMVK